MAGETGSGESGGEGADLERRAVLLAELEATVERLLAAVDAIPAPDVAVTDSWSARDVLGHLTFWHESFARNVDDLVHGRRPTPIGGRLSDLNERSVAETRTEPLDGVVDRLLAAQATIRASILSPVLGEIPYRVGSRTYTAAEHLEIVRDHMRGHTRSLERALRQVT